MKNIAIDIQDPLQNYEMVKWEFSRLKRIFESQNNKLNGICIEHIPFINAPRWTRIYHNALIEVKKIYYTQHSQNFTDNILNTYNEFRSWLLIVKTANDIQKEITHDLIDWCISNENDPKAIITLEYMQIEGAFNSWFDPIMRILSPKVKDLTLHEIALKQALLFSYENERAINSINANEFLIDTGMKSTGELISLFKQMKDKANRIDFITGKRGDTKSRNAQLSRYEKILPELKGRFHKAYEEGHKEYKELQKK